jgi:hypothetical protein
MKRSCSIEYRIYRLEAKSSIKSPFVVNFTGSDGEPSLTAFVRDLGIFIDSDLVMRTHVQRTVSRCFAALRQLRQIRRSLPAATFQSLVVALVHARLDYGNSLLVGIPA